MNAKRAPDVDALEEPIVASNGKTPIQDWVSERPGDIQITIGELNDPEFMGRLRRDAPTSERRPRMLTIGEMNLRRALGNPLLEYTPSPDHQTYTTNMRVPKSDGETPQNIIPKIFDEIKKVFPVSIRIEGQAGNAASWSAQSVDGNTWGLAHSGLHITTSVDERGATLHIELRAADEVTRTKYHRRGTQDPDAEIKAASFSLGTTLDSIFRPATSGLPSNIIRSEPRRAWDLLEVYKSKYLANEVEGGTELERETDASPVGPATPVLDDTVEAEAAE